MRQTPPQYESNKLKHAPTPTNKKFRWINKGKREYHICSPIFLLKKKKTLIIKIKKRGEKHMSERPKGPPKTSIVRNKNK